jgi:hypothetical protein
MKKILLLAGALCLLFTSCEDFLDSFPESQISEGSFWKSESDFEKFIINIYANTFVGRGNVGSTWADDAMSDDSYLVWTWYWGDVYTVANSTATEYNSVSSGVWSRAYGNVRRCYQVLEHIEGAPISDSAKEQFLGEVNFFLAWNYFQLVRCFGDVPLVEKVMTIPESKELVRAPKADVVTFILGKIDQAASGLNGKTTGYGKISWGATQVLKARVQLFNNDFPGAATTANGLIGKYTLNPSYEALFDGSAEQANEIILTLPRMPRSGSFNSGSTANQAFGMKGSVAGDPYRSVTPTGALVDAYPMADGRLIHEAGSTYDPRDPYKDRDPRLAISIIYPTGQIPIYDAATSSVISVLYDPEDASTIALQQYSANEPSATGYVWKKLTDWSNHAMMNATDCGLDIVLMRYAEVLLIRAEALAESQGTGASREIFDLVNQLRDRVGGGRVHEENYTTKEALINLVRNEKRVELAGEGQRFWDMRRWGLASSNVVEKGYGLAGELYGAYMRLDGQGADNRTTTVDGVPRRYVETRFFTSPKNDLLPIPQSQIDLSPSLTQNPGW